MRVVIFEPDPTGHHFAYLAHVIPALAELACEPILLTTPAAANSSQFAQHFGSLAHRFQVASTLAEFARQQTLSNLSRQLFDLKRALTPLQPDHLYVAYGDGLAQVVGLSRWFGGRNWGPDTAAEVLLMRGGYTYGGQRLLARMRNRIAPHLIRHGGWDRVHHLNPDCLAVLRNMGGDFAERCRLMPDPIEPLPAVSKSEARQRLGISENGRYLGCAGLIDPRKGIDLLLRAFKTASSRLRSDDRLLLAGPVDPRIQIIIEREMAAELRDGRIVAINRQMTPAEINLAVIAMDVVCTPYPRHIHSASIVIRAAAAGRPVLGSAIGWTDRTVRQFGLGATCDVADPKALAESICTSLDGAAGFQPNEAARRFAIFHSDENFVAHWTGRIRERLGLPPDDRLIRWDWVTAALA